MKHISFCAKGPVSQSCRGICGGNKRFPFSLPFKRSVSAKGNQETRCSHQNLLWEVPNQQLLNLPDRSPPFGRETLGASCHFGCPFSSVPYTPASVTPPGRRAEPEVCGTPGWKQPITGPVLPSVAPSLSLSVISPGPRKSPECQWKAKWPERKGRRESAGHRKMFPSMCCRSRKTDTLQVR